MKKTVKLFGIAAIAAAIALILAGCNLGTSGFGTITIPGLPEPPPPLPPPSFNLETQREEYPWQWVVTDDNTVIIVGYLGSGGHVDIPGTLDGLPVVAIARPEYAGVWMPGWYPGFVGPPVFGTSGHATITGIRPGPDGQLQIEWEGNPPSGTLTSVTIPDSVLAIGRGAFWDNRQLTSVNLPPNLISIAEYAFFFNGLTSLSIPQGVTYIGDLAFAGNEIGGSLFIPPSVRYLGGAAFENNRLESVVIAYGLTEIQHWTFSSNSPLASVAIPASVNSIGEDAFNATGGQSLVSVTFGGVIAPENIGRFNAVGVWQCAFPGDLSLRFAAGGPGTYVRAPGGGTWSRQN